LGESTTKADWFGDDMTPQLPKLQSQDRNRGRGSDLAKLVVPELPKRKTMNLSGDSLDARTATAARLDALHQRPAQ